MSRSGVLRAVADRVLTLGLEHPARVAVDGCSAAGKSTLADELAAALPGDRVIRVGLDHFKRRVDLRTGYPPGSPESYYHEMYDVDAIRALLLEPVGPSGSRNFRTEIMDLPGRTPIDSPARTADDDAILIADGAFLLRPALFPLWDLRIYLDVDLDTVQRRGAARDQAWMDSYERAAERYRTYYVPGERLYLAEIDPAARADVVIDNRDVDDPRIIVRR